MMSKTPGRSISFLSHVERFSACETEQIVQSLLGLPLSLERKQQKHTQTHVTTLYKTWALRDLFAH